VTSPEKILLEEQPLPTHRKALPDRLPRENVLLDVEDKVCERKRTEFTLEKAGAILQG
jgi:hypothetical protein